MYLNFEEAYKKYLIYIDNKLKQQTKRVLKGRFENQIIPYWREFNVFCVNEFDYLKWQNEIELNSYSKLDIENPIIRINTAFKGCSSLEKISVLPRIYHN